MNPASGRSEAFGAPGHLADLVIERRGLRDHRPPELETRGHNRAPHLAGGPHNRELNSHDVMSAAGRASIIAWGSHR